MGAFGPDKHPPFPFPATLSFIDPDLTVKELQLGVDELKFKSACIGTNINGMALDNQSLCPFLRPYIRIRKIILSKI